MKIHMHMPVLQSIFTKTNERVLGGGVPALDPPKVGVGFSFRQT